MSRGRGQIRPSRSSPHHTGDPVIGDGLKIGDTPLPATGPAEYTLTALGEAAGSFSLTAKHEADGLYTGHSAAVAVLDAGGRGHFRTSVNPGATPPVALELVSVVGVQRASSSPTFDLTIAPNPSASSQIIRCALPQPARVRVEVFDVAGRRVRQLMDRRLDGGSHDIAWDGLDDSGRSPGAGFFFVRLQTADGIRVARCVRVTA